MTPESRSPAVHPASQAQPAARLLALRAALRALPARADVHPMNGGPSGVAEMDLLRLLALRGLLVAWAAVLYDGVQPDALARAAAALDTLTASLDAGRATFYENCGYGSDYHISFIEQDYDGVRLAVRWLREALAERPHVPVAVAPTSAGYVRDAFDTLQFFGPEGWQDRQEWRRVQAEAFATDRAQLALDGSAAAVRALALAPLWPDSPSAAAAANLTFDARVKLLRRPAAPLGDHALRWLAERTHGVLVLGHAPDAEAERFVRIANLSNAFWDGGSGRDVGHMLDDCLYRKLEDPGWGTVQPFK